MPQNTGPRLQRMDKQKMIVFVKFRSELPFEEVMKVVHERIDRFRALKGLQQKYYIHDPATGEFGGIYIWESREDLDEYNASELRATIAEAYKVVGAPRVEALEVVEILK